MNPVYFDSIISDPKQPEQIIEFLKLAKQARTELSLEDRIAVVDRQAGLNNPFIDTLELILVGGEAPLHFQNCNFL